MTIWLTPKWYEKQLRLPNFLKDIFIPNWGIPIWTIWHHVVRITFFYKSDKAQQEDDTAQLLSDTAQLLSETGQPVSSKDGRFHLLNKYIKDFSNIPSGGIACAHASDSLGVAPTATWNFRTRKKTQCLCVQNKNLVTRIYHISRTEYDMGLSRQAWRLDNRTRRMLIT